MRKGLTLIELILSMVIIGIVFTVIPRLIMSMNQAAQTTVKEEAMFNALALMGAIINLPWDENNTANDQILLTNSLPLDNPNSVLYDCNTSSGYRIGGFIGSRNCRTTSTELNLTASSLGHDTIAIDDYNDIDDYSTDINTTNDCAKVAGTSLYAINPKVIYSQDPDPTASIMQLPGDDKNLSTGTSNTKRIIIKVGYHDTNKHKGCITALEYHSFNLGNIQINSRTW